LCTPLVKPRHPNDERGRSAQHFEMVVQAREGTTVRTAIASGRDIYAISAPLVVEAAARMMQPGFRQFGACALAQTEAKT